MPARTSSIRMNHAVEHATVSVLLGRGVQTPIGGYSLPSGFMIWGTAGEGEVASAAKEALELLRTGHADLAISSYCGTNAAAGVLIGAIAAALVAGRNRGFRSQLGAAIAGFVAASTLGKPVGRLIQRWLTTDAQVGGLQIRTVRLLTKTPVSIVWISTQAG